MASLGEFSYLNKSLALGEKCSCGLALDECPRWALLFDRVRRDRGIDLRLTPYALRQWDTHVTVLVDNRQQTPAYVWARKARTAWLYFRFASPPAMQKLLAMPSTLATGIDHTFYLYDLIREEWGKQVVIDSTKNVQKALALHERNPDAVRIILLTRDGRGVYYSHRSTQFSPKDSLDGWLNYYQRAVPLLERNLPPAHLLKLRYEDLVTDTEQTLRQVCHFVELPYDAQMLDYSSGERHVANGNNTRFARAKGITPDERWKTELLHEDLAYFIKHGSKLNNRLGYR